jgi:hypothetical protein
LEVQKDAQIEVNTTFGNLKGTNIFWVAEKVIKQMKRSQNPGMVDGNDRNDMEDMVDMEHQGEEKYHVLTTMKNNPNRKEKEEKSKKMLIEIMATHEALTKNFFESNLKKIFNLIFPYTFDSRSECDE